MQFTRKIQMINRNTDLIIIGILITLVIVMLLPYFVPIPIAYDLVQDDKLQRQIDSKNNWYSCTGLRANDCQIVLANLNKWVYDLERVCSYIAWEQVAQEQYIESFDTYHKVTDSVGHNEYWIGVCND